jgi:hypothetical protein
LVGGVEIRRVRGSLAIDLQVLHLWGPEVHFRK